MKIVYYLPNTVNPFWREVVAGMEDRARAERIGLELVSSDSDATLQLSQLQDYQRKQPDAVFISPVDMKGISPLCKSVLNSGVHIFSIDQNLVPNVTGSVISGNMKGGILAATYLADRLEPGSRIVHIRAEQGLQNVALRSTSFMDEVGRRGLKVVHHIQADSNRSVASAKMSKFLQEGKPFDAIFAENDNMALGAVSALKQSRLSPYPLVVGYDGIPEALEAIRNGSMDATIAQEPGTLGQTAIDVLLLAEKGGAFQPVTTVLPRLITRSQLTTVAFDGASLSEKPFLSR